MHTAEKIRKLGFKRWYERALLEGHAYLVTCFLGMIVAIAGIEVVGGRQGLGQVLVGVAVGGLGVGVCLFSWQRYHRILILAEHLGAGATCGRCGHYARFGLIGSGGSDMDDPREQPQERGPIWLHVKCRECGNEWVI
ncbi:hypothetical protein SVA_2517 [Sulfurifustis variabilis]|uniref:Uncharacterized protein n=2 Tax=Sulfurifustis variabilis TaxID=1675686 RepID=A0A1B4V6L7_9GAMM|nr:hypothetical protein SVA_2517 [Sulfurifustis variabilis]